jgi:hypothetical protein
MPRVNLGTSPIPFIQTTKDVFTRMNKPLFHSPYTKPPCLAQCLVPLSLQRDPIPPLHTLAVVHYLLQGSDVYPRNLPPTHCSVVLMNDEDVVVAGLSSRTVLGSIHVPMYSQCRHTPPPPCGTPGGFSPDKLTCHLHTRELPSCQRPTQPHTDGDRMAPTRKPKHAHMQSPTSTGFRV